MNKLEAVEPTSEFYECAPVVFEGRASFPVPVQELWDLLDEVDIPPFRTEWFSAAPHSTGSLRKLFIAGRHVNTECFTRIEPRTEMRFYLDELSARGVRAIAAVMSFEADTEERSAIRWRIAIAPRALRHRTASLPLVRRLGSPVMSAGMKLAFGYGLRRRRHQIRSE
jgi:hypothetical protein